LANAWKKTECFAEIKLLYLWIILNAIGINNNNNNNKQQQDRYNKSKSLSELFDPETDLFTSDG